MRISLRGAACAALGLSGCLFSASEDSPRPTGTVWKTFSIVVEPGRILASDPDYKSLTFCDGDTLRTVPASVDTFAYELNGDSLLLIGNPNPFPDSVPVQEVVKYVRLGKGSGLNGIWILSAEEYRITAPLSPADSAIYQARAEAERKRLARHTYSILIRDGSMTNYSDQTPAEAFAETFVDREYPAQTGANATLSVSVQTIGDSAVVLVGEITKQRVRLVLSRNGDREYSSENPVLPVHEYYEHPSACPNALEPEWYFPFLQANTKPTSPAKAAP